MPGPPKLGIKAIGKITKIRKIPKIKILLNLLIF